VKQLEANAPIDEILRLSELIGVSLRPKQCEDLAWHLARVLEANQRFNLTTITDPEDAIRLHVVDSLAALPEVEESPIGSLADLGSGAGFPGVPLGITSGRSVLLVESVGKKARFLQEVAVGLSSRYSIAVSNVRAEDVAQTGQGRFAVATARALSSLASLVELSAPLLVMGGRLVALKGPVSSDEIAAGDAAGEIVGLERVGARGLELPEVGESRTLVTYRKIRESRIELPRRIGSAQRRPLA
jgi:16S rRNA (guanine527-N7)-methyltransferase